jgi:HK97 family phage major capsid protein
MSRVKQLQEQIAEKRSALLAIDQKCENESRARTEEEKKEFNELRSEIENLNTELVDAKDAEEFRKAQAEADKEARKAANAVASTWTSNEGEKEELRKLDEQVGAKEIVTSLMRGNSLKGALAELDQEARNEITSFGGMVNDGSVNIPVSAIEAVAEKRATVDQTNSAIKPTVVGAYVDQLRESAVYEKVGVDQLMGLTADYKIPAVGDQAVAWATAENSAAPDIGAQFTSDTLTPFRVTGYVPLSNRILLQNGEAAYQSIFRDLGRSTANLIDAAMWSTTDVTNAPGSIPAKSGVGTFTEALYSANVSILSDFIEAEQVLADAEGLEGNLAYVAATNLMNDLKKSAQVSAVIPSFGQGAIPTMGMSNINGYPTCFTVAATKSAGVSGDFLFGNMSQIKLGWFGGLSITRDTISGLKNDEVHIVLHRYVDWGIVRGAAFVKATSLVA